MGCLVAGIEYQLLRGTLEWFESLPLLMLVGLHFSLSSRFLAGGMTLRGMGMR